MKICCRIFKTAGTIEIVSSPGEPRRNLMGKLTPTSEARQDRVAVRSLAIENSESQAGR